MPTAREIMASIERRLAELEQGSAQLEAAWRALVTGHRAVAASEGLNTTEIAARVGADRDRVLAALSEIEAGGGTRRSEVRRHARWQAITGEDRTAQRTGELAAQVLGSPDSVTEGRA
jgi:hypothetical protein